MNAEKVSARRGQKVILLGKHPHAGQIGNYMGTEMTLLGMARLIHLDNGQRCYVYKSEEFKLLTV